jgi:phosphoglucomutase|uniref:Phosphoglucomutase/phosphomannomutase family protein n=1 Tax=Desulfobacca acetoxidans TaxID=60893 RepID=A0A7V6A5E6_9BACT
MVNIKFGTSGWRGILADDFTFANARLVCQGIADYLKKEGKADQGIVIGYDTRFLSETFAATAAEIMAGNGIPSFFTNRDTPTPVVSFAIRDAQRGGGINITASHNPPEWNGIKFNPSQGGPAPSAVTSVIEGIIREIDPEKVKSIPFAEAQDRGLITLINPRQGYLDHVAGLLDTDALRRAGLKIAVDLLYGTGRDYLDAFLRENGVTVEVLHDYRDPLFGGHRPEPSAEFLEPLAARIKETGAHLGLAVDADADRFGVMDGEGRYYDTNLLLGLLFDHLIRTRGWEGGVARSVATSHLVDKVAAANGRPVFETKVGFKHLGAYISNGQALMVGEEAEGFSMKGHLPEKDGILACVMVAEMVAKTGNSLPELRDDLFARVGPVYTQRLDLRLPPTAKARFLEKIKALPETFAGLKVVGHVTLDGDKYLLENGSWVCFRPSGTEPVVRFYLEADSPAGLERLRLAGGALLREL